MSQNISWSKHIDIITCKANSILAFLHRNLSQCSLRVKSLAYFTYVRPVSVVWSPFTQSNIDKIEKVQRKAARFVFNDYYRYSQWRIQDGAFGANAPPPPPCGGVMSAMLLIKTASKFYVRPTKISLKLTKICTFFTNSPESKAKRKSN